MHHAFGRAPRAMAILCLVCLVVMAVDMAWGAEALHPPTGGERLTLKTHPLPVYAFLPKSRAPDDSASSSNSSPESPAPRPLTIYLHGMCGEPAHGCGYFRHGVSDASWLLCPSAPAP
ncbi:MAG TPA: hypothetical protein VNO21_21545, partial [Polyangiaceae bacterium]|nr:hypothetical protein [Polyangiaceae bacterium]